jgi:putative SOS response-associated peptidase YedK
LSGKWEAARICNLYTKRKSAAEDARHFNVHNAVASNAPEEAYPGTPGLVIREEAGERGMQSMTWGFPLRLKGIPSTAKPKPVNNIADLRKPMWIGLVRKPQWRCLIPLTAASTALLCRPGPSRQWRICKLCNRRHNQR